VVSSLKKNPNISLNWTSNYSSNGAVSSNLKGSISRQFLFDSFPFFPFLKKYEVTNDFCDFLFVYVVLFP
jgi:hypothetical protein